MKVYSVHSPEFQEFGKPLSGYDFSSLLSALEKKTIPDAGIYYTPSDDALEAQAVFKEVMERGFGGMPVQIGYVSGRSHVLDCLEYHKGNEFNIAADDVILIVGNTCHIKDGVFDSANCMAFLLPRGTAVEFYATTLHYAPIHMTESGYRVACVLPRGTNTDFTPAERIDTEDAWLLAKNKWVATFADTDSAKDGMYVGLTGKNIDFSMLEF